MLPNSSAAKSQSLKCVLFNSHKIEEMFANENLTWVRRYTYEKNYASDADLLRNVNFGHQGACQNAHGN